MSGPTGSSIKNHFNVAFSFVQITTLFREMRQKYFSCLPQILVHPVCIYCSKQSVSFRTFRLIFDHITKLQICLLEELATQWLQNTGGIRIFVGIYQRIIASVFEYRMRICKYEGIHFDTTMYEIHDFGGHVSSANSYRRFSGVVHEQFLCTLRGNKLLV